jgi:hypothetical protein
MIHLCEVTVPGLRFADVPALRRVLVPAFANVRGVVATTRPGTVQVVYDGPEQLSAWCAEITRAGWGHSQGHTAAA